jgi:peptide chain release factor 1
VLEESSFGPSLYRSASIRITGKSVERLIAEAGTHRVSRIPWNERKGRRHTSAVTVSVLPVPERISAVLDMKDVTVEFFRASGKGGQHRNKTETAVRAVHKPTGLRAVIADERSQSSNKDRALALLAARVAERRQNAADQRIGAKRSEQHGSGHISERFRSYLWREGIVVDHESGRSAPLRQVLDGDFSWV